MDQPDRVRLLVNSLRVVDLGRVFDWKGGPYYGPTHNAKRYSAAPVCSLERRKEGGAILQELHAPFQKSNLETKGESTVSFNFSYKKQEDDFFELARVLRRMSIRLRSAPEPELLSAKTKVEAAVAKAFSDDPGATDISALAGELVREFNKQRDDMHNPLRGQ